MLRTACLMGPSRPPVLRPLQQPSASSPSRPRPSKARHLGILAEGDGRGRGGARRGRTGRAGFRCPFVSSESTAHPSLLSSQASRIGYNLVLLTAEKTDRQHRHRPSHRPLFGIPGRVVVAFSCAFLVLSWGSGLALGCSAAPSRPAGCSLALLA